MRRHTLRTLWIVAGLAGVCLGGGAAPATSSFRAIEQTIERVKQGWPKPDAVKDANAHGWNSLFDGLLKDLRTYSRAESEADRLAALGRVHNVSRELESVSWAPAKELRDELGRWLRPRTRLAWAERKLIDSVHGLPTAPSAAARENRDRWVEFVDHDLERQLQQYDAAATVARRLEALKAVRESLAALDARNQAGEWGPSQELELALQAMFAQPNFAIEADLPTIKPTFERNLVTTGPVHRKGYIAQVTAGPKTGFGLIPSNDAIAFYNRQRYTSVTPVWDFNQQIAADPEGQRVTRMYCFTATSIDHAEITIATGIRPSGLSLKPSYSHDVSLQIGSAPVQGGELARFLASLIGFDQQRINQQVWEGALPRTRTNLEREALEEGTQRTSKEAADRNVTWSQYLHGNGRASYGKLLVEHLTLQTRPDAVRISGTLGYGTRPFGSDSPRPPEFAHPDPGVSADLHLGSILTNFATGYFESDTVKAVDNLMIVTGGASGDGKAEAIAENPPGPGFKVTRNVDYATYLRAVESSKKAGDTKAIALRVHRPTAPPEFAVDANGHLVAVIHNFHVEVPYSAQAAKAGGVVGMPPAKVLRITAPHAEVAISVRVVPPTETEPLRIAGRVESFDPGPGLKIYALNDDDNQPAPLTTFTAALVIVGVKAKIQGQAINVPLRNLQLPLEGFALRSVSPLDPSGWVRLTLSRTTGEVPKVSHR